jgi:hypothetical protein
MQSPRFISLERYQRAKRIHWKNPHSRRLQHTVGDKQLVVGYDQKVKRWLIARLCKRYIVEKLGRREFTSEVTIPVVWKTWEEGAGGHALSITHPDLPKYIMKCDRHRRAKELDKEWAYDDQKEIWRMQSRKRERREVAKELWKPFQKMADDSVGTVSRWGPGRSSYSFLGG